MEITVRLFATFRNGRAKEMSLQLEEGVEVRTVLKNLAIAEKEVAILLVNGRDASPEKKLAPGDIVALFPPVGGG